MFPKISLVGLHYIAVREVQEGETFGGGWEGSVRPSWARRRAVSGRGSMWRGRMTVRLLVVGRMTSTILMVLNLSMIWRGVRPGARARDMARKVASRHRAMKAVKMCASMRSSRR